MTKTIPTRQTAVEPPITEDASQPDSVKTGSGTPDKTTRKEPGSRSGWIAGALVIGLVGWMGSGFVFSAVEQTKAPVGAAKVARLVSVEATPSRAQRVTQYLVSEGQALPDRLTEIRSGAAGTVESLGVAKGDRVTEGEVIARLAAEDRSARQSEADAELVRRERDFSAVQSLVDRGYATRARLEESRAALASARAQIAAIGESFKDTEILAPFGGILDDLTIEVGEVLTGGAVVGVLVDVDPLIVEIQIPQQSVGKVRAGQDAEISFITGETRTGTIRYVSANARPATRTFAVEIAVPNPNGDVPAGISAQARIPVGETQAHFVSPAVLSLGSDGTLGVKTVGADDTVIFHPIEMVRAETKGIWITGLPDAARIISVGQGFVSDGDRVSAVASAAEPAPPAPEIETPAGGGGVVAAGDGPAMSAPTGLAADSQPIETERNMPIMQPIEPVPGRPDMGKPAAAAGDAEAVDRAGSDPALDMTDATERVQRALNVLGYRVGAVDGIMGEKTREAIRAFQLSVDGEPTGGITPDLINALDRAVKSRG